MESNKQQSNRPDATISGNQTANGPPVAVGMSAPGFQESGRSSDSIHGQATSGAAQPGISTATDFKSAAEDLAGPDIEVIDLSLRYELHGKIGVGGMGEVYRGSDRRLKNRPVAIKRLKPELARDAKQLQRFVDEAQTIAQLSHAHIVHVYDYGRDAQGPFLILEFIDGETLAERLKRGPLELHEAIRLLVPICEAVTFAHQHGVIHRDIKPANILISTTGTAKLGDFGIARQLETERHTTTGAILGTFDYMSPEQLRDSTQVDSRSDQWSLACTLYEALTGRSPRYFEPDALPPKVREIIVRARRMNPDDRFATVDEFSDALRSAITVNNTVNSVEELAEGECRNCHTVNRSDRKFCKKQGCGAPLNEACPGCQTQVPVWDVICGECGADIPAAWADREQEVLSKSQQIESHLAEYRFADAERLLAEITALNGKRWQAWRTWAQDCAQRTQSEKREQEGFRDQLFDSASTAFKASDYDQTLSLLEQIPDPLQTTETRELAGRAQVCRDELKSLLQELRQMVQTKQIEGLREMIDRVLILSPNDPRVAKLDQQLRQRDAQAASRTNQLHEQAQNAIVQFDYADAVKRDCLAELQAAISQLDSELEDHQLIGPVQEALRLHPNRGDLQEVLASLPKFLLRPGTQAGERIAIDFHGLEIAFRWCPAGKFKMGSSANEAGRSNDENQVNVELTQGFWLGETVVTQALFQEVLNADPSHFKGSQRPVETVSWDEAQTFCKRLTEQLREAGILAPDWRACLPTEARWEYACRAGTTTAYCFGNDAAQLVQFAWFNENSSDKTYPVGTRGANPWGLRDMHGNVLEWCADWYGNKLVGGTNLVGPATGSGRVGRGGAWFSSAGRCRSAFRLRFDPSYRDRDLGFRLCLSSD